MTGFDDKFTHNTRQIFAERAGPGLFISTDILMKVMPDCPLGLHTRHFSRTIPYADATAARIDIFYDPVNGIYHGALHLAVDGKDLRAQLSAHQLTDFTYRIDTLVHDGQKVNLADLAAARAALDSYAGFVGAAWPRAGRDMILFARPLRPEHIEPAVDLGPSNPRGSKIQK